ncbi:hypothetical protein EB796_021617 [Bugula neritina]|uniref:Uncharacterized protein n=1 Tax=Bugula neritina TaxID=10212 RepID=A0A7J7J1M0_BUGNE|nr:hypothetical protein EB796_021617 [Bugula neritina]
MKDQLERKRAKELLQLQKLREAEESAAAYKQPEVEELSDDSDDDSDDEESQERRAIKRKAAAQRYWGIIRRDVQEKIRIRKEKNPAGGTWNALRSQLRALTRGDNVRQELYEKYGIVPKAGFKTAEDSMKPTLSINIKEVVNRFQSLQVRKLKVTFG